MDLPTLGIFLLSFLLCAGLVLAVSLFGAKEKSFEEAIEEQKRKRNKENEKKKPKEAKKVNKNFKKKAQANVGQKVRDPF